MFVLSGCNQANSRDELQKLRGPVSEFAAKWIEAYGDGPEALKNYNIALTQQVLNKQAAAIEELAKRVDRIDKSLTLRDEVIEYLKDELEK